MAAEPAITTYGAKSSEAPSELDTFSFLVGKWQGSGKTQAPDGTNVQFDIRWIGRYILNGTAIADEFHSLTPDGSPYLGISLRSFDSQHGCWIIEYVNVSNSFLRRQVNAHAGSVQCTGNSVVVISGDGQTQIRETYQRADDTHFTYSMASSPDGGQHWDAASLEISLERVE